MIEQKCVFCAIIDKKVSAKLIAENDEILVIQDRTPKAPIHYLIIPKIHCEDIRGFSVDTSVYASKILLMASELAQGLSGSQACRLIINNGADVGQSVFHIHCHFLSGKRMIDF
jgi:histidine triad (HIT) family protein